MKRPTAVLLLPVLAAAAPPPCAPGQVLARFAARLDPAEATAALGLPGLTVERLLCPRLDIALVRLDPSWDLPRALEALRGHPALRWAQADHLLAERLLPNDTEFPQQWALQQASGADIDAPEAWDLGTGGVDALGREIVVAVVDNGMELTHPDLALNLWVNPGEVPGNLLDDDGDGFIDDYNGWDAYSGDGSIPAGNGHGTHVAGIVGARGNNGSQVAGVNWNVRLMAVAGSSTLTSTVSAAYNFVLEQKSQWLETGGTNGANVVATNSSFGVNYGNCSSGEYPIWNDLYNAMGGAGILSCAATMNINANVDIQGDVPTSCNSPWLVTVTNTTQTDVRNAGAAWGPTTIDLGAPGTQVRSTYSGGSTAPLTGTSMSSPHVAGAVAFLHAVASDSLLALTVADPAAAALVVKELLLANVDHLPDLNNMVVSDGRLNLHQAARAAARWPLPLVLATITRQADARLRLEWNEAGAAAYHVERRAALGLPWERVATVAGTDWTSEPQPPDAQALYRVIAEMP
jgi:subtilisin family serine protease